MNNFWYDLIKPKYGEKVKLWYKIVYKIVDTVSFIDHVKTEDILEDVKKRFDNSNYEVDGLLPIGKN